MKRISYTRNIVCKRCKKEVCATGNSQKWCKECSTIYKLEKRQEKHRATYIPNPKAVLCKKCGKEELATNPCQKFCKECSKLNHIEYQRTYNKNYRHTDRGKEAYKRLTMKRRAKLNSVRETFTMEEWFKKVDKTKGMCPGYKRDSHFIGKEKLTLDHNPPLSKAPKNFIYTINNVTPLCGSCNSRKRNKEKTLLIDIIETFIYDYSLNTIYEY